MKAPIINPELVDPGDVKELLAIWEKRLGDRRMDKVRLDEQIDALEKEIDGLKAKIQEHKALLGRAGVALNGSDPDRKNNLRGHNLATVTEFLKANPNKTCREITDATGLGYQSADSILKNHKRYFERDSEKRWRLIEKGSTMKDVLEAFTKD